jgi:hypothetical protein
MDLDRAALSRTLDETQQSWLLAGPGDQGRKKKRYVDLGCLLVSRKIFLWTVGVLLAAAALAGIGAGIAKAIPRHHSPPPPPDQYTVALRKALMFFNAQKCESESHPHRYDVLQFVHLRGRLDFSCWRGGDFGFDLGLFRVRPVPKSRTSRFSIWGFCWFCGCKFVIWGFFPLD